MRKHLVYACLIFGCVSNTSGRLDIDGLKRELGPQCEIFRSRDDGAIEIDATGNLFLQEISFGKWVLIGRNANGGARIRVNERQLESVGSNPRVSALSLIGANLEGTSLAGLSRSSIKRISLAGVELTSLQTREISNFESLEELDLRGVELTRDAWEQLSGSQIKKLTLLGSQLDGLPSDIFESFERLEVVECIGSSQRSEVGKNAFQIPIRIVRVSTQGGVI